MKQGLFYKNTEDEILNVERLGGAVVHVEFEQVASFDLGIQTKFYQRCPSLYKIFDLLSNIIVLSDAFEPKALEIQNVVEKGRGDLLEAVVERVVDVEPQKFHI